MEQPATPPFEALRARGLLVQCAVSALTLVIVPRLIAGQLDAAPPSPNDPVTFVLFYLGIAIVLIYRSRLAGLDTGRLFGPVPSPEMLRLTLVAPALAVLSIAGFWVLFLPVSFLAPDFVQRWAIDSAAVMSPATLSSWTGHFIIAVIIAPVIEETFFRGLLLQRWALKYGTFTGVMLSSGLFAIGHVELLGHFVFGVAMSALYLRTRSLWVPIAAHSLNNFLASMFMLPAAISAGSAVKDMTLASFQSQWWIGLLIGVAGLALLETYRRWFWDGVDIAALLHGPVPYLSDVGPTVATTVATTD